MDTTDKNIRKVLSHYETNFELGMEEEVIRGIGRQKGYGALRFRFKGKVKFGILLTTVLGIVHFLLIYFGCWGNPNSKDLDLHTYLPSIYGAMLIVVLYAMLFFKLESLKKSDSQISKAKYKPLN
ncbi:hypothetical protein FGF1_17020 [Flavobacteriaceae bacterium GF1]